MKLKNRRGSILLEGVFSVSLVVFSIFLLLEMVRATLIHIAIDQSAFLYLRERVVGNSPEKAEKRVRSFLEDFFGSPFRFNLKIEEFYENKDRLARVKVRYPQFLKFFVGSQSKHHMETTKVCRFPG